MPELPEVETIRARLEPAVAGRVFERVEIHDPHLTRPRDPYAVAAELTGERVAALERRGKYLIFRFESGLCLVVHLRMTGTLRHATAGTLPADPHRRAVVRLDDGSDVAYRDVRRFGTWLVLRGDEVESYLAARLGPEPLGAGFTARALAEGLAGRRAPVKAVVLDQRVVAGAGNIYADEALWWAGVHPLRRAGDLTPGEVRALRRAVRRVLGLAVAYEGTTLSDYALPDGRRGSMRDRLRVYGRAGEPCPRCRTPIEKTRAAGRGTHYCPRCQPPAAA